MDGLASEDTIECSVQTGVEKQLVLRFDGLRATFAAQGVQQAQSFRLPALPHLVAIGPASCNARTDAVRFLVRHGRVHPSHPICRP